MQIFSLAEMQRPVPVFYTARISENFISRSSPLYTENIYK